ncbi:MAG: DNA polymerase I [Brevibacterium sp.]|uniref:DNA polymerase I n=1 Tax=Brevibacterium sp. TaxID=1701 RepID=UPI002647F966|nr:DNA polymerase I [Brevibacterium sp.]MDN5832397.1 DNA polymerase I [Brevibacterium sp.]MDN5909742.1 DNA polymerase I [Brevibacterium sp.]MDN6133350.1 DNA polymerase I [Brevibacterium sp.]MDN6603476.1 DNA polymerase I [Brevibacterium sp.]MDN6665330.1 DNA polymerase I [Brevibacterium sp.]
MTQVNESLLLIDGHSLAYRAFHALPVENFATSTGQSTNAIYGFISMLINVLRDESPSHVAVAFDKGRQTFRLEEYPEYKAGRAKTPPEFHPQIDLIKDIVVAMGITVVTKEGFEADDALATMARMGTEAGAQVEVMSGDKDSFQLSNETVTILYPKRGVSDLNRMTPAAIEEKYAVAPANYRGLAALVGEKADNLPGVPGVGDKTAAKWLTTYGDLPGVLENAEAIKGKVGEKLRDHIPEVERNFKLNRLLDDVDLDLSYADLKWGDGDPTELSSLFDQLEFQALGKRLSAIFGEEAVPSEASRPARETVVETLDVEQLLDRIADADVLALDSDAGFELGHGDVSVLAVSAEPGHSWVVDFAEAGESELEALTAALRRRSLILHSAKLQLKAWTSQGLVLDDVSGDTALAAYLLVPDARTYELGQIAMDRAGIDLTEPEAESGQLPLDLGSDQTSQTHGQRAAALLEVHEVLAEAIAAANMNQVYRDIELPLVPVLAKMELAGIAVDEAGLSGLIEQFTKQADASAELAHAAIGHEVNLGSPKQLQTVLFDELDMPKTKRTKTGYTTDADALAELFIKTEHPFLQHLLAYRDSTKLKQTVVGLLKTVAEDGRIHTTYQQTVAATGRLSSLDPNLQNIPVRTESGRRIREIFIADPKVEGGLLLTADYSQIEMRIMAHLSGDAALIQAFKDGEDLHSYVGSKVFGVGIDEVDSAMRSKVKAMSYGLVYGLSAYGLSRQLTIGVDEAKNLMDQYFERFGAVKSYLDEIVEQARANGYTETIMGRRRYLPALHSDRRQLRDMAERAALNAPIQGSAADIMKIAMLKVSDRLGDVKSRVLLQVHDEIIVDVHPEEIESVAAIVTEEMGSAFELDVPLDVNVGTGISWHAAAH